MVESVKSAVINQRLSYFIRFLIFAPVFVCVIGASAQYRFDHWTADAGLPQNSVYAVTQTRDGYLWLATSDGLARFDGARFTIFNKGNSPGISSNRFVCLYEDFAGDLWAGTEDGGITRLRQGRFTSFGIEQGLPDLRVVWITGDAAGNATALFSDARIARWSGEKFLPVDSTTNAVQTTAVEQRKNKYTFCNVDYAAGQIDCFVNGRLKKFSRADGLPSVNLTFKGGVEDRNGMLWLSTTDAGLVRIENDRIVKIYTERDGLPGSPVALTEGERVSLLSKDRAGVFWLTDLETMQNQRAAASATPMPFDSPNIRIYEDRESNLWIGTFRDGLFRARQQFITSYSIADGLAENNVYPIYEDRRGAIWIGTTGGLFKYENGVFAQEEAAGKIVVTAIGENAAGRLLVAASNAVLVNEDGQFKTLYKNNLPLSNVIWTVYDDGAGSLWLGGENGLTRINGGVETVYTTKDGLAGNDVKIIIPDNAGGFWIGTYGGLSHYKNGQFTSWTEKDGLPSRTVRSLYQDTNGVLWIGTYDGGLGRFADGKFTRYTTKDGLFNDGVFQILEDFRGNFWMSSNRGIYRVSRAELNEFAEGKRRTITSVAYGKSDGMLNVEGNGGRSPAGIKARDGRLWFPTQDGAAVIDPEKLTINPRPPPVMIESFLLDNAPANFDGEIKIQPNQENFEINYTALSFINSENLRFRYKLENLDNDWTEAGTRRTAYYTHVPAGEYVFKVIAANSDGVWNEEGKSLPITILPPFYRTWWFYALTVLTVTAIGFLTFRFRIRQIERRHAVETAFSRRLIDSQEQERKRIAAELHDSIGQLLVIIKNRARMGLKSGEIPSAAVEHLDEISTASSQAIDEVKEISFDLRPYLLDKLGLTKTIKSMLKKVFASSETNLSAEIDDIDDAFAKDSEILFYRIIQESASNIVKHARANNAKVTIERAARKITLRIRDDGQGFDAAAQASSANRSFGLIGIGERARLLGGTHSIASETGKGTTVTIEIELPNE